MAEDNASITGLILAGGRGSRMGGVDKGLQGLDGRPMVAHVVERLRPQVGALMISANRHVDQYSSFGVPVLRDANDQFDGPLAGMLAGLAAAHTDWIVCAACDVPLLPQDLVARLLAAKEDALVAIPRSRDGRLQPLFALLHTSLRDSLATALAAGDRRVADWMLSHPHCIVDFDEEDFMNLNTRAELEAQQSQQQQQ